jgi:outer membrane protein OmpA-like peptidoglycan-associated protein
MRYQKLFEAPPTLEEFPFVNGTCNGVLFNNPVWDFQTINPRSEAREWEISRLTQRQKGILETVSGFPRYSNLVRSLPAKEQQKIDRIARLIVDSYQPGRQPIHTVQLIGHADQDTPRRPDFEKRISGDRALAVQKALMDGINLQRSGLTRQINWQVTKAGATQLIVPNPVTELERAQNRRVEILLGARSKGGAVVPNRPPDIPWIQGCLNHILGTHLATDGRMGPKTQTAIRGFQQQQGLPVNGLFTPQTLTALAHSCSGPPIPPANEPTGLLVMTVFSNGAVTDQCRIEVLIDNKLVSGDVSSPGLIFSIPPHPRPLPIKILAHPITAKHWPLVGNFQYQVNQQLVAIGDTPPEFVSGSVVPFTLPNGQRVLPLTIVLSRVRNTTQDVLQKLRDNKPTDPPWSRPTAPTTWDTPEKTNINFIAPTPKTPSGDLQFEAKTLDPDTEDLVLEIYGVEAPQLIAVSWPKRVPRNSSATPTPFLIYFRPTLMQNVHEKFGGLKKGPVEGSVYVGEKDGHSLGSYPWGWDFLFFGMWTSLDYAGDPLTNPFRKGLPYQIDVSGKGVVLISPCSKFPKVENLGEFGEFMNASFVQEILQEIQAFMFRRGPEPSFSPPPLGRVALTAFSSGNTFITQFLQNNQKQAFYRHHLQELYLFDPPKSQIGSLVQQVNAWLNPDKILRAYTQDRHPEYSRLRILSSSKQSVTLLPIAAWMKARTDRGRRTPPDPRMQYQLTHQLISAMMLTDALRKSGF